MDRNKEDMQQRAMSWYITWAAAEDGASACWSHTLPYEKYAQQNFPEAKVTSSDFNLHSKTHRFQPS